MKTIFFKHTAFLWMFAGLIYSCTMKEMENGYDTNFEMDSNTSDSNSTLYFYYYGDEKQYFELDTRYIFVSAADEQAANSFVSENIKPASLRIYK